MISEILNGSAGPRAQRGARLASARRRPSALALLLGLLSVVSSLVAPAVYGDSQPAPAPSTNAVSAEPLTPPSTNALVTKPLPAAGYVADSKYKLRVGDRVSFQILEDRDAAKSLVVADSGELDVPCVGRVPAVDKSCKQLADELRGMLEKDYYYQATVILALDMANRFLGRVYVWGQVKNQGPIDIAVNENLTAGKAILRAGGFADFANRKKVKVLRSAAREPKSKQVFELNMVEILDDGKTEKDLPLQPEDSIIVPSRLINF